jgi:hypothetical protein
MMATKGQMREALALWIPAGSKNVSEMLANLNACRHALDEFLDGRLPLTDYLEFLAGHGVDMDDYAEVTDDNLSILV